MPAAVPVPVTVVPVTVVPLTVVPLTVVRAATDRRGTVLTPLDHLAALPEQPPVVLGAAGRGVSHVEDDVAHGPGTVAGDRPGRARLQAREALVPSWLRRSLPTTLRHSASYARPPRSPAWRGAVPDALWNVSAVVPERRVPLADVERPVRVLGTAA